MARINERIDITIPGIEYEVTTSDGKKFYLSFLHKTNEGVMIHGLTNEDVLDVVIHRLEQQNSVKSDHCNNRALYLLREGKRFLDQRRFDKINFRNKQKILNK